MESAQDKYKKWGIALIIFLLILIPAEIALTRPNAIQNLQLSLKLATQEKPEVTVINKQISEIRKEQHPSLFFLDLEYDPLINKAAKISSGKSYGDLEPLSPKPSSSSGVFNYRIEAISPKGELISSGWASLYLTVITTEDGKYNFRASSPYVLGGNLNVYSSSNEKLWQELIQ